MRKTKTKAKKKTVKNTVKHAIKKMGKRELEKYKKLLLVEKSKLMGEMAYLTDDALNKSQKDVSGDLSGYSYHIADMATDHYDREFSLGLATNEQRILYKIDEATKRISDGTYGVCLECGKAIPKRRLVAMPYAYYCIKCQKKLDTGSGKTIV